MRAVLVYAAASSRVARAQPLRAIDAAKTVAAGSPRWRLYEDSGYKLEGVPTVFHRSHNYTAAQLSGPSGDDARLRRVARNLVSCAEVNQHFDQRGAAR